MTGRMTSAKPASAGSALQGEEGGQHQRGKTGEDEHQASRHGPCG